MPDVFIPFGKHRGNRLDDVDPGYLTWMLNKSEQLDAGKCGQCGRTLTDPESIEMGLGPRCTEKS